LKGEAPLFQIGPNYGPTGVPYRYMGIESGEVIFAQFTSAEISGTYRLYADRSSLSSAYPRIRLSNSSNGSLIYGSSFPIVGFDFAIGASTGTTWAFMKDGNSNPTPYAIAHAPGGLDEVLTNRNLALAAIWNRLGQSAWSSNLHIPPVQGPKRLTLNSEVYAENASQHPEFLAQNKVASVRQSTRVELWAEVMARMPKLLDDKRPDSGLSIPDNRVSITAKIDYGVGTANRYESVSVGTAYSDRLGQVWISYTTPRLKANTQGKLMAATITFSTQSDMLRSFVEYGLTFPEKNIASAPRSTARIVVTP
jgi:hypothetical protein